MTVTGSCVTRLCPALQSESRAVAIDMKRHHCRSGLSLPVPYGTLLCVSDKPLHEGNQASGTGKPVLRRAISEHLQIGIRAIDLLRQKASAALTLRTLTNRLPLITIRKIMPHPITVIGPASVVATSRPDGMSSRAQMPGRANTARRMMKTGLGLITLASMARRAGTGAKRQGSASCRWPLSGSGPRAGQYG